jgi:hypothetical protein
MLRDQIRFIKARIPVPWNTRLRQWRNRLFHPLWFGTLRRTRPLSNVWGFDRGTPIDRYYIEQFLKQYRQDIHGEVLEIKDNNYTYRYGNRLTSSEIMDLDPANSKATLIADLSKIDVIPDNQFNCFILTQTLQLIYDLKEAIANSQRLLKPGGVLLATLPGISRVDGPSANNDYWRFTPASVTALFVEVFGTEQITVQTYGNVLAAIAFLTGAAVAELSPAELEVQDSFFPVIIAVRAVKSPE